MSTPRVDIRYVREHPDVRFETVTNHYGIALVRSGSNQDQCKILCPFHDDHDPSCGVNVRKKQFHCFPCGAGGNILDFVMRMEEIDARKAAIRLAEICEIETAPSRSSGAKKRLSPAERLKQRRGQSGQTESEIHTPAEAPKRLDTDENGATTKETVRSENLEPNADSEAKPEFKPYTQALQLEFEHPYLAERGLDPEFAEAMEIGFCKAGYQRNRIAIRLHDPDGNPIGYVGRWAGAEVPEKEPRYKLPPHLPKHKLLYNFHRIPEGTEEIVLVESYWSVFRLQRMDVPAIASMGWALSPEQIELLVYREINRVTVLFDGDDAGRSGAIAAVTELSKCLFARAPDVPDGFKPHKANEALLGELIR